MNRAFEENETCRTHTYTAGNVEMGQSSVGRPAIGGAHGKSRERGHETRVVPTPMGQRSMCRRNARRVLRKKVGDARDALPLRARNSRYYRLIHK